MTAVERLRAYGYRFALGSDGVVRVSLAGGLSPPEEAERLLAWCREHREEVKTEVIAASGMERPSVRVDSWLLDDDDMRIAAWVRVFDKGLAELVKVSVHRLNGEVDRVDVHYIPIAEDWVIEAEVNLK